MTRTIGQRYEVLERLGDGTFFHVARARDQSTGRTVVVKVLQSQAAEDEAFCGALRKSGSQTIGLTHPNVARVYEVCDVAGKPVLVTEFVRGMDLKERIKRIAPFTLSVAVEFAIAIGEAVQSAHSAGVLHGDLRAHNVMVTPDGVVKVTDFGMAAALAASPAMEAEQASRAAGYEAPEVASGGPRTIAGDVYGLGAILYEMLTGALPRHGEAGSIVSPRALNTGVPLALEGVVMKALARRPQDRYVQVADMLNDLRTIRDALRFGRSLAWSPTTPPPPTETPSPQPRTKGPATPSPSTAPAARTPAAPASAPAAATGGSRAMPSVRESDDGVSPVIKTALAVVASLILVVIIVGVAIWLSAISAPPMRTVPNLVGMSMDEVKALTDKAHVRVIPHAEFNDTVERDHVIRSDWPAGRPIQAGRTINVWVSRGSRMVWVPNLLQLTATDAESKLQGSGLTLGAVDRAYSDTVPQDCVASQNPAPGKRIPRDQPVNLTMSDGPNPSGTAQTSPPTADTGTGSADDTGVASTPDTGSNTDGQAHRYTLRVAIPHDGRGVRNVRIEYEDAYGTQTPVDSDYGEGAVITKTVEAYGPQITVRVYYDDDASPVSERTESLVGARR